MKLKRKTNLEIAKSVRKPMPPPTKVDKDKSKYNRQAFKKGVK